MNRLPGFDRTTRRSEAAVFASLGLAGIISISVATSAFVQFVTDQDRVVQVLTMNPLDIAGKSSDQSSPAALTNVTLFQNQRALPKAAAPGKA